MAGDVDVRRRGFLHDRTQLLDGELGGVDAVARGVHRAAGVDLDVVCAAAYFLPDRTPHLGHAVTDHPDGRSEVVVVVHAATWAPPVSGTPGLCELLSSEEDARPLEIAILDCFRQPEVAAAHVANTG